jgi:plasmid stabilization system protein ParE
MTDKPRDAEDWERLRDALAAEDGDVAAVRLIVQLRAAIAALPASGPGAVPPLWFDDGNEHVRLSVEGTPRVIVTGRYADAVRELIAALGTERIMRKKADEK